MRDIHEKNDNEHMHIASMTTNASRKNRISLSTRIKSIREREKEHHPPLRINDDIVSSLFARGLGPLFFLSMGYVPRLYT